MKKNNWLTNVKKWSELPGYQYGLYLFRRTTFKNVLYILYAMFALLLILDSMVLIDLPVPVFIGWGVFVLAGFLVLYSYFKYEHTSILCFYLVFVSFWWMGAVLNTGGIGSPIFFYAEVLLIFYALSGSSLTNLFGTVMYLFVILTSFVISLPTQEKMIFEHLHEIPVHLLTIAIGFLLSIAVRYYEQSYEEWQNKALTDYLTGLDNREGFTENRTWTESRTGLFGLLDLNGFKQVNDTYGHQTGDRLLITVAHALKRTFPSSVQWGRIGGDEFVFYMPHTSKEEQDKICHQIEDVIASCGKDLEIEISAAVGGIPIAPDCYTFHELYKRADEKMYDKKKRSLSGLDA